MLFIDAQTKGRNAAKSTAFVGTFGHAAADLLGKFRRIVFGKTVHQGFHEDALRSMGNIHLCIADLHAALAQLIFIVQCIPAVTGDAVVFPGDEGIEPMQLGIFHHQLEGRALIIAAGKVTVYVLFDNDIPVGFGVCHTIPALSLDALLGLTAAWGVAVVGDGGKQFFRVIFRHKKSTSEKWV